MTYSSKKILKEGLSRLDMKGQVDPIIAIDEYQAKMGPDSDVVTLSLVVNSKLVGEDLVFWFEKGYDFVLDASVSLGEISPGKYIVFVEIERRSTVPAKVIKLLKDLETLTDLTVDKWKIKIDDKKYKASEDVIKQLVILNPNRYRNEKEKENELAKLELNEMLDIAGLSTNGSSKDKEISDFVNLSR